MDSKAVGWEEAYEKAKAFVSQLTLLEKVNLTTGIGYVTREPHPVLHASANEKLTTRHTVGALNNASARQAPSPDLA